MSAWLRVFSLSVALAAAGCAATPAPNQRDMAGGGGATFASWTSEDYRYRIGPGDELSVRFVINPDLNATVVVGPDGRGVFPLISAQDVAGLTAEEANALLSRAYATVLRAPQVETLVAGYGASQIYVGGEVRDAGVKTIKGRLTVAQAVMSAGGFQETARTGRVVVIRQRPGDPRLLMRTIDVRDNLNGRGGDDFAVLPGDLIFVPRSAITEVNRFVRQYVTGVLPFNFNYSINRGTRY
ncbi:polysaccharide biosynthesis/export family protein [Caulobacter segnis]|uniref:Polysaccharide export protein n=1 Tax=Caulobacter segnis (strain ATCC 21756 / DSM 7131 / JCM 7823 / NBRC 15250 / LMG 17158 / TK0059) TaxID=509190 RepID=D5VJD0_CAUST|nr:polysaccharide biosynthesis/export family protein [Caulobacter segnis]ADG10339.1 polysaccharide export protein [Caulobacter segnis ATCC 21756]